MSLILTCLVISAFLPYFAHCFSVAYKIKNLQGESYDNNETRKKSQALEGMGGRAWAAQANAWEAVGVFTVACVVLVLGQGDLEKAGAAAIVFVISRVVHTLLYVGDLAYPRSLAFSVGLGACAYIMYLGLNGGAI